MIEDARPVLREDWWSVLTGLLFVTICVVAYRSGYGPHAVVAPRPGDGPAELVAQLGRNMHWYAGLGLGLVVLFASAAVGQGLHPVRFAAGFAALLALAIGAFGLAAWSPLRRIAVEPPVVALLLGVLLSNLFVLPRWLREAMRAELYLKTGVVLLGASVPLALLRGVGVVAVVQESLVAFITFITIYAVARFLGAERRLGAMLAAGGSGCGVPAVLAVAGAVRARREDVSIATMIVVVWALGMVVLQPMLARAWYLPAGGAGAWIGTSESGDAAGLVAVQVYGDFLKGGQLLGQPGQALLAYTMVKSVARELWIGVWVVGLALYAVLRWEPDESRVARPSAIWSRFPKYVIGFIAASVLVSWATDFGTVVQPELLQPIGMLRDLLFTLSLLSVGATVPLHSMAPVGGNAFLAFATGVVVNLMIGFILVMFIFRDYWDSLSR